MSVPKAIPEDIKLFFSYDPTSGDITGVAGSPIRRKDADGYIIVRHQNRDFPAHRVAWFLQTGDQPPVDLQIDHKNHDKADNRWDNLRLATRSQNLVFRQASPERDLPRGVRRMNGKFAAQFKGAGRTFRREGFKTLEEALACYRSMVASHHGPEWLVA